MRGSRWPPPRGDAVSRSASRLVLAAAALLLGLGVLTAAVVAMREPFALNDYAAIWGLKARALSRSLSLESLFRVDPEGAFSHPEYPPLWPLLLAAVAGAVRRYDDLAVTPLWPALTLSASLLAVRAARSMRVAAPFALLAGAAVSLLPYWRRYPGYAEGLLLVLVLAAAGEAAELRARTGRDRAPLDLPDARGVDEARGPRRRAPRGGRPRVRAALPGRGSRLRLGDAVRGAPVGARGPPLRPAGAADRVRVGRVLLFQGGFRAVGAPLGGRSFGGLVLAAAGVFALAPATFRRRRALFAWAGLVALSLIGSLAFSRFDPAWHVRWSWDRILVVPLAVLIPVLAEALAECVLGKSAPALPSASPEASPPEAPAPAP